MFQEYVPATKTEHFYQDKLLCPKGYREKMNFLLTSLTLKETIKQRN